MNSVRRTWWSFLNRNGGRAKEPGAALFQGLRVRLTLWYCAVLGAALLLFCVVLYLIAYYLLLGSVNDGIAAHASEHARDWQAGSFERACFPNSSFPGSIGDRFGRSSGPTPPGQPELIACYDQHGTLIQASGSSQLPAAFLSNTLALAALNTRDARDTVNAGGSFGLISRYALVVVDPHGPGYLGVVLTGAPIGAPTGQLSTLLILLVSVGGVTLLGAGLGGLFLANRALAPAHLAFTRQQRFIADASHELRTPLTLMRADAEVLLRGRARLAEEDVALLEDIVAEANHMSQLANSMLTLARLDASTQHREHEVVSLDALASRGVQRVAALAAQKNIILQCQASGAALIIGDPTLLEQAVLVLLDNAIKYNRSEGQVTVRTSITSRTVGQADKGGQARLEVSDTGIGIPPEHLPHLSERFYRVDKARSREAGGTGLGLSIAHGIAAAHNGSLTLTSQPGQGTTATLLFPLADVASTPPQTLQTLQSSPQATRTIV
ncbi:MAG: hypothetical protein NVSMB44_20900 [Ktedonobacteraceae bacterium]